MRKSLEHLGSSRNLDVPDRLETDILMDEPKPFDEHLREIDGLDAIEELKEIQSIIDNLPADDGMDMYAEEKQEIRELQHILNNLPDNEDNIDTAEKKVDDEILSQQKIAEARNAVLRTFRDNEKDER